MLGCLLELIILNKFLSGTQLWVVSIVDMACCAIERLILDKQLELTYGTPVLVQPLLDKRHRRLIGCFRNEVAHLSARHLPVHLVLKLCWKFYPNVFGLVLVEVSNDEHHDASMHLLFINVMLGLWIIRYHLLGLIFRHVLIVIVISLETFITIQVAWYTSSVLVILFNLTTLAYLGWPRDVSGWI
jgi:hypothetical protein